MGSISGLFLLTSVLFVAVTSLKQLSADPKWQESEVTRFAAAGAWVVSIFPIH
jgi:Co/Zn/Cd efflux system component